MIVLSMQACCWDRTAPRPKSDASVSKTYVPSFSIDYEISFPNISDIKSIEVFSSTSGGDCSVQEMMWRSGLLFVLLSAAVWSAVCGLQCYQCESYNTPSCKDAGNTNGWSTCQDDPCFTAIAFGRLGNRIC